MSKPANPITVPILTLAALTAMAPLAIDAYLPALPTIANDYQVNIHAVELSLSIFLAGFALGQLIGGPISDHLGRRLSIFGGMVLFLLGTVGIIFSPTIEWMWAFRFLEALGGGLAIVNPSAIIRDLSSGLDSAKNMAHMSIIMLMAPLLAPLIGMLILQFSQWQSIFVFLFLYCFFISVIIFKRLPETRVIHPERPSALQRYWQVLSHRQAMGYGFSQSFSYGGIFAFITASPLVYIEYFGVSETVYPFLFGANIAGLMIFNRINVFFLRSYTPSQILKFGQIVQIFICSGSLIYILQSSAPQLEVVVAFIVTFSCFQSLIVSNATACTIEFFPKNSATATALIGANGFLTGSLAGAAVGVMGDGTPYPMALTMFICTILGFSLRALLQMNPSPPSTED